MRGGLSLAAYTIAFCWALRLTSASHVALYIGASPVWALLVEQRPQKNWSSVRRYGAALLAVTGVLVLFWPALKNSSFNLAGECCGLGSSLLWANYNHQSRILARTIHGVEVAANAMWMSGVWLLPIATDRNHPARPGAGRAASRHSVAGHPVRRRGAVCAVELRPAPLADQPRDAVQQFDSAVHDVWAHFALGEPITPTFCAAMVLIVAGVALGQMDWSKVFKEPESF